MTTYLVFERHSNNDLQFRGSTNASSAEKAAEKALSYGELSKVKKYNSADLVAVAAGNVNGYKVR